MDDEMIKAMGFRLTQVKADNTNANQPAQNLERRRSSSSFAGFINSDAKRMSFDANSTPNTLLSQSPGTFGLTGGLIGGSFNRDRRDSLKNMVHLQDFGTD